MAGAFSSAFSSAFDILGGVVTPGGLSVSIAASNILQKTVTLTATVSGGTSPYQVFWIRNTKSIFVPRSPIAIGKGTPFNDSGLSASTTYYYQCVIVDAAGKYAVSTPLIVRTLEAVSADINVDTSDKATKGGYGLRFDGSSGRFVRF